MQLGEFLEYTMSAPFIVDGAKISDTHTSTWNRQIWLGQENEKFIS